MPFSGVYYYRCQKLFGDLEKNENRWPTTTSFGRHYNVPFRVGIGTYFGRPYNVPFRSGTLGPSLDVHTTSGAIWEMTMPYQDRKVILLKVIFIKMEKWVKRHNLGVALSLIFALLVWHRLAKNCLGYLLLLLKVIISNCVPKTNFFFDKNVLLR